MKKVFTFLMALALVVAMVVPVYATTPPLQVPDMPEVPEFKTNIKISDDFWDKWFKDHPIEVPSVTLPMETEPEETEPEVTELDTPVVTEARYYHSGISRLQIQWDAVDGADSYVVLIVAADGVVTTHVVNTNMLYLKNNGCPKVYVENTSTWESATVRVMAVTGDVISEWSEIKNIGCDALH